MKAQKKKFDGKNVKLVCKTNHKPTRIFFSNRDTKETFPLHFIIKNKNIIINFSLVEVVTNLGYEVLDLYYECSGTIKKVGLQYYNYKKDKPLHFIDFENRELCLFITPKGNIKICTYLAGLNISNIRKNWVIGEKGDTAQDNGIVFFNYMRLNHPELPVYYIIDENCKDAQYLNDENVVFRGTPKQIKICLEACVFIGTHDLEYFVPFRVSRFNNEAKRIFLPHGIMGRKNVEYHKFLYQAPFDLMITSSQDESNMLHRDYKYNLKECIVCGLPRFDNLKITSEKYILIMPTWREWINEYTNFTETEYFNTFNNLLNSKKLLKLAQDSGYKILFYPHYRMQKYLSNFTIDSSIVEVISINKYSIPELLNMSEIMITDYSSVAFDMHYVNKKVIYYQFDYDKFFTLPLVRKKEIAFPSFIGSDLVSIENEIISYFTTKKVEELPNGVFDYIDQHNCERVYNSIIKNINHKRYANYYTIIRDLKVTLINLLKSYIRRLV